MAMMCALVTEIGDEQKLEEYAGKLATAFIKRNLIIWIQRESKFMICYWYAAYQTKEVRKLMKEEFGWDMPRTNVEEEWEKEARQKQEIKEKKENSWFSKLRRKLSKSYE